ncbi:DUF998 domain-containing protein [Mycobacterium sp. TNTM28]|uniref:DUF998 domain-containing protein n=1 Tax=[Mycobacterium] fortunisiensis TaxID=2600579 RepID=A0ABS6KMT0_9MYCO|nr:DUF998 domain-containing protein [[Mycobacterium] fortunisiensis]MBU9764891.1 DUF998 domain-containing protein [[Mycobacterium] fortunisiensis]
MTSARTMLHQPRFASHAALTTLFYFAAEWVVSATWRGHYAYRDNPVGPLGVPFCGPSGNWPCSALYPAMNVAFVVTGIAVSAVALSWTLRKAVSVPNGLLLFAAGTGLVVAGTITQQRDYPVHHAAMTVFLVLGSVSIFLVGSSKTTELDTGARRFALAAGVAGMVGYFAYVGNLTSVLGPGGTERLVVYSTLVAIIVLSWSGRTLPTAAAPVEAELEGAGAVIER